MTVLSKMPSTKEEVSQVVDSIPPAGGEVIFPPTATSEAARVSGWLALHEPELKTNLHLEAQ